MFYGIYAVRVGSLKTFTTNWNGREHIHGFYLNGDILGFDAFRSNRHVVSAKCLETTILCSLSLTEIERLSRGGNLEMRLLKAAGEEYCRQLRLGRGYSVSERTAQFLLDIDERMRPYRTTAGNIELPMSREDIANYLRCSAETLSRSLSRLQQAGAIVVNRRRLKIVDFDALRTLGAGG